MPCTDLLDQALFIYHALMPSAEVGLPTAQQLLERLADSLYMALKQILKVLSGIHSANAIKIGMVPMPDKLTRVA